MKVVETTNNVYNTSLYAATTVQTVPYWLRVTVATRLAKGGKDWVALFSRTLT